MKMKNTDKLHISGLDTLVDGVETITFSEFISDVTPEVDHASHSLFIHIRNIK